MFNAKQTIELMARSGWTPELFADSLNSTARMEAHAAYRRTGKVPAVVPQISIEVAAQFMKNGTGINGDAFDVVERWVERRTGFTNNVGAVFARPAEGRKLNEHVAPPVILPEDFEMAQDVVGFKDITNERARAKMILGSVNSRIV